MGRPTKLTPELQAALCAELEHCGVYLEDACEIVGVRPNKVYEWLSKGELAEDGVYAEFRDALKKARALAKRSALQKILAGDTGWQSVAWFLERTDPKNYGRRDPVVAELKELKDRFDKIRQLPTEQLEVEFKKLGSGGSDE